MYTTQSDFINNTKKKNKNARQYMKHIAKGAKILRISVIKQNMCLNCAHNEHEYIYVYTS